MFPCTLIAAEAAYPSQIFPCMLEHITVLALGKLHARETFIFTVLTQGICKLHARGTLCSLSSQRVFTLYASGTSILSSHSMPGELTFTVLALKLHARGTYIFTVLAGGKLHIPLIFTVLAWDKHPLL